MIFVKISIVPKLKRFEEKSFIYFSFPFFTLLTNKSYFSFIFFPFLSLVFLSLPFIFFSLKLLPKYSVNILSSIRILCKNTMVHYTDCSSRTLLILLLWYFLCCTRKFPYLRRFIDLFL